MDLIAIVVVIKRLLRASASPPACLSENPNQGADREEVKEGKQIRCGEVNAAVRTRPAEGQLVAESVDVNVPPKGVHVTAAVIARL